MGDEYGIYYQPELAAARVGAARTALLFRLGSVLLSVLVIGGVWLLWPATFGEMAAIFLIVTLVTGGIMALINGVQLVRVAAEAKLATPGLAVGINRDGMLIGQRWLAWPEVGSMVVKPGVFGSSSSLVTLGRDNASSTVPLELTDAMPASLDSVVRVLSSGRAFVDLSRLD